MPMRNQSAKQLLTRDMLAAIAAQEMRERPGCRGTKLVEIDVTPLDWSLGNVVAPQCNPGEISRGKIIVQRDMKLKYDLIRLAGTARLTTRNTDTQMEAP